MKIIAGTKEFQCTGDRPPPTTHIQSSCFASPSENNYSVASIHSDVDIYSFRALGHNNITFHVF